jgi:hypothetical protein
MLFDFVDGEKFKAICDFELGQNTPDKSEVIMYAPSDRYLEALVFIEKNSDVKFKLVTHNGDTEILLRKSFLPRNLVCWYAQNLCTASNRTFPIPIGMENSHWHPGKRDTIIKAEKSQQRVLRAFTQFNPSTHKSRLDLANLIMDKKIDVDFAPSVNGTGFEQYVYNLSRYAFCVCPRGNGTDTHRIWEALYMGCIPIVQTHLTHKCLDGLPVLFVENWQEITHQKLVHFIEQMPSIIYDAKKLHFKYWENLIKDEENRCGCR